MRYLLSGGGTSGHTMPAVAIADAIKRQDPDAKFLFIGRKDGTENNIYIQRNYPLKEIEISGIRRQFSLENVKTVIKIISSVNKCKKIVADFKPDAIIGTGGYVCWPVLRVGIKKQIPVFVHESNSIPGFVTRLVANKCDRVFLSFENCEDNYKRKDNLLCTGTPVRNEFFTTNRQHARRKLGLRDKDFLILSFAGSGGAKRFNEILIEFMNRYSSKFPNVKHIHATGIKYYDSSIEVPSHCTLTPFIKDIATHICAADLAITRSGALTISELVAAGCASILVPSPNVANNHQFKNAQMLSLSNAAILIEESNLTVEVLADTIKKIIENTTMRNKLIHNILKLSKKDSANMIAADVINTIKKRSAQK